MFQKLMHEKNMKSLFLEGDDDINNEGDNVIDNEGEKNIDIEEDYVGT